MVLQLRNELITMEIQNESKFKWSALIRANLVSLSKRSLSCDVCWSNWIESGSTSGYRIQNENFHFNVVSIRELNWIELKLAVIRQVEKAGDHRYDLVNFLIFPALWTFTKSRMIIHYCDYHHTTGIKDVTHKIAFFWR